MTQPTNRRFVMEPRLDAEVATINTQLNLKAPLASPALTGTPTSTTAAVDTSTTQIATTAFVTNQAAAATSPMDGTAAVGTSKRYARQDHVHPTDTTRAPLASPALTGTPTSTTAAADTNTTQIATTAYVVGQASATAPVMDGTATVGTSLKYARADHVHPTDTSRAPAAGSSSITTVGTIASGTWQGTDVALAYGGTNASLTAVNGGAVYSDAAGLAITAAGTSGQVLKSNGAAAPTWQTNNLDSLSDVIITTPSAGQTLAYNGTNWINGSGGGGGVTASATAPASPVNGSAWFDTNDGTLYVYYTDVNGSQWVEVQADSALGSQLATRMSTAETNITALQAPGRIVQTVQTNKTTTFSTSTVGSWVDVTGFSATITPKSASNKIVINADFMATVSTTAIWQFRLVRGSTPIGGGDNSASLRQSAMSAVIFDAGAGFTQYNAYAQSFNFMDSPATTAATTYKIQAWATGASTLYVGRSQNWGNATDYAAWSSNLLLMEVAG